MQYILFDLDGTITDPKEGITKSVAYALDYFGIKENDCDRLCKFIGPPLKNSFKEYYDFEEEKASLAVEKYREYFSANGLYQNVVYEGIEEMLQKLSVKGKKAILATSKPTVYAEQILQYFGLEKYFWFVAGSNLDGTRSKKGEVIRYALEENSIQDISMVVMVGDREHDIIGAKEVGILSVGILYGYGSKEELERAGADMIFPTVETLTDYLVKC